MDVWCLLREEDERRKGNRSINKRRGKDFVVSDIRIKNGGETISACFFLAGRQNTKDDSKTTGTSDQSHSNSSHNPVDSIILKHIVLSVFSILVFLVCR